MVLSLLRDVATLYTRVTPVDQAVSEFWIAADWEYCEDVTTDLLILVFFPRCLGKKLCMYVCHTVGFCAFIDWNCVIHAMWSIMLIVCSDFSVIAERRKELGSCSSQMGRYGL